MFWFIVGGVAALIIWRLFVGDIRLVYEGPWLGAHAALGLGLLVVYMYGRIRIIRNFLAPHGGFVCPRCHYPLRTLKDEGACPECGTSYTRASVVELWERSYGLRKRYPRISARDARSPVAPSAARAPAAKRAPWATWSLPDALARVEAGARTRGFAGGRFPSFPHELDAFTEQLRPRQLPSDLHAFYAWIDLNLWSRFIHQEHKETQAADPQDAMAQWTGAAQAQFEQVRIRPPSRVTVTTLREIAAEREEARRVVESSGASDAWLSSTLVAFADASDNRTLYYCVNPVEMPRGSILVFTSDPPFMLKLGDSLSQWLTRLAMCEGIDALLAPNLSAALKPEIVQALSIESGA